MARVLEDTEIDGLLLWFDVEKYGMVVFNIHPADKIGSPVAAVSSSVQAEHGVQEGNTNGSRGAPCSRHRAFLMNYAIVERGA